MNPIDFIWKMLFRKDYDEWQNTKEYLKKERQLFNEEVQKQLAELESK